MLGIIALFYLVYERNKLVGTANHCPGGDIKIQGEIRSMEEKNGLLFLNVAFPGKNLTKVVIYDYCQARMIGSVEAGR